MTNQDIKIKYGADVVPLYKGEPPFMSFKDGYGLQGVLLYDTSEDKIQCHFCGNWYRKIQNNHLKKHRLTAYEYKERVGLYRKSGLMGIGTRTKLEVTSRANYKQKEAKLNAGKKNRKYKKGETRKLGKKTAMWHNSRGICEAQLYERLKQLAIELDRPVGTRDDHALTSALRRRFGSFGKAMLHYGLPTRVRGERI